MIEVKLLLRVPRSTQQEGWACSQQAHMHTVCMHIYTQLAAQTKTDRKCSSHGHTQCERIDPSYSGWARWRFINEKIYINMYSGDPSSTRLRHSAQCQSLDSSFPSGALTHRSSQCCNPTLAAGRDFCTQQHRHRHTHMAAGLKTWDFPSRNALATPASCTHTQMVSQSIPRLHRLSGSWLK